MKSYTIKNVCSELGMWPVSAKAGIHKMRQYTKSICQKNKKDKQKAPSLNALFEHLISRVETQLTEWIERDLYTWSSPSKKQYVEILRLAKVQLSYAHLIDGEHQAIQTWLLEDQKRRATSRKSFYKGGAISVADARKKKDNRDKTDHDDAIWKAQTAINCYVNKAKNELKARGIQACKEEKACKKRLQEFLSRGEELPIGINIPVLDPEKPPSDADLEVFLPHPSLLEALDAAMLVSGQKPRVVLGQERFEEIAETTKISSVRTRAGEAGLEPGREEDDNEIELVTEVVEEEPGQVDLNDSSGSEADQAGPLLVDFSDAASECSTIDSIARNADFVAFS